MISKWLQFENERESDTGKTKLWDVYSTNKVDEEDLGVFLGEVRWHGAWRKYAFFPEPNLLFGNTETHQ